VRKSAFDRAVTALIALTAAMLCMAGAALAQTPEKKVAVDLIADKRVAVPGETVWVALRQKIEPGWHTYWSNPGDSGEATRISWKLPQGFRASEIRWPLPEGIPVGSLMNFGYSDEVLLLSQIMVPMDAEGPVTLTADAGWLVCKEICIPEEGSASLKLDIGAGGQVSDQARLIGDAVAKLPAAAPWRASFAASQDAIDLTIDGTFNPDRISMLRFFPNEWGHVVYAAEQKVTWAGGSPTLSLRRGDLKDKPIDKFSGLLVVEEQLDGQRVRHGFEVQATGMPGTSATMGLVSAAASPALGLWQAMLFAMAGGIMLNLMPCVFPVLSLKALSLAKHGSEHGTERRRQGLAYLAGVLVSFAVLVAILLVLRATGEALGWGFQFQSPAFVLAMAALFFALGLSLSGVFLIGTSVTNLGSAATTQGGLRGSFFTGVLASIAATPCTAPFMGAAIGYALTQPAIVAIAVLLTLGLGFALPIVGLSFSATLARLLPKPGRWMETMKQVLAFPLYASAGWMAWVLSVQSGSAGVLAAVVVLLAVGFVAWLLGEPSRVGTMSKAAAVAILLLSAVGGYRLLDTPATTAQAGAGSHDTLAEPFSQKRLDALLAQGKPVFVNFTAAWCITCKVNEQVALNSAAFRRALGDGGITYLKGDWTRQNPEITAVLQAFGRAGVPLYVYYSGKPGSTPQVLPQLLTEAVVLEHLAATPLTPKPSNGDQS
jgi:thiol:disulfide interchange protein/DsbC/DsbD-like thiol-disulfide interchange protein